MVSIAAIVAVACFIASAAQLPEGVVEFDTAPGSAGRVDTGYPTRAMTLTDKYLWVGRAGGFRRYDRQTGEWSFYRYTAQCPGFGTISLIADAPYIWARLTNTGTICRFDTTDGAWHSLSHWSVLEHTGPGSAFIPTKDVLYVASSGGPDWEGVSLIDRHTEKWIKLLKTKPVSAMLIVGKRLWLGVPAGILRIDSLTEEYRYFQPYEHGGGALVKDIIEIPGGLAFATFGDRTSILGDKLKINSNTIQIYIKETDRWYTYKKSERDRIINDVQTGKLIVTNINTHPGLLIYRDDKWTLLTKEDGLQTNDVQSLARDENFLYAGTLMGITVFDMKTMKPIVINHNISVAMRQVRKVLVDDEYLWIVSMRGLFRVDKKVLFSTPRKRNK